MRGQLGFFDLEDRYAQLGRSSNRLDTMIAAANFERFRYRPVKSLQRPDRLSFVRFLGLGCATRCRMP